MRKLITISIISAIMIVLFTGCKTKISMTKRHYNKGYYFAQSHTAKQINPKPSENNFVSEPFLTKEIISKQNDINKSENSNNKIIPGNVTAKIEKKNNQFHSHQTVNTGLNQPTKVFKDFQEIKPAPFKQKINAATSDDALSLFWIIIVVILILWLFGFLAGGWGLGGLINLLLVIALILLILWLLRVV